MAVAARAVDHLRASSGVYLLLQPFEEGRLEGSKTLLAVCQFKLAPEPARFEAQLVKPVPTKYRNTYV